MGLPRQDESRIFLGRMKEAKTLTGTTAPMIIAGVYRRVQYRLVVEIENG